MKKREAYDLAFSPDRSTFLFESTGPKGRVQKIIEFGSLPNDRWNLGFGDIAGDDWHDHIITDNKDMRKVLQTVANAIHLFTERYPGRKVHIQPLDRQRKLLYNRIFQQKWDEISDVFSVHGIRLTEEGAEGALEYYDPLLMYDVFVLTRKKPIFEQ